MSTTALQGLLDYLYGTLSPDNMRWVAEHLVMQADKVENPDLKPYTMEELHERIKASEADFAAGRYHDFDDVIREIEEELDKEEVLDMAEAV